MSLKAFHVLFIAASSVLAFGMAAWCLKLHPLAAAAAAGVGIALIGYEVWFLRKVRRLP